MRKLLVSFIILFTLIFSYTILAQEIGSLRRNDRKNIPVKLMKPAGPPLAAGTYTIGSGGDFPTIDSAFNKLSVDGIAGEVILELTDNLYTAPTDDYGFLLNGPIPGANQNNRVTIKPADNKNVTIEASGIGVFNLNNVSFITFDGVDLTGSTTLTIKSYYNTQFEFNDCLDFWDNSDNNIIQNIVFICGDHTRISCAISFWNLSNPNPLANPDSNLIRNNFIKEGAFGIFIGNSTTNARPTGNEINGNKIGSESDSLIGRGIQIEFTQNTIIQNNSIQNLKITPEQSYPGFGIVSFFGSGDIIRNNIVHNIKNSHQLLSEGIRLTGEVGYHGSNNMVYNNLVYDIQGASTQNDGAVSGIGIKMQDNPKIYYNSVYLTGSGANVQGSAALYVDQGCTNVDVRNNILVNTRDESPYCATAIYDYSASNILTFDYNDLFYDNTNQNNCLVKIGGTNYNTLADWQTTGKDLHSITEMPNFMAADDLHMDSGYLTNTESRAAPIAGIDTDFDGDARDSQHPDIGADEFDGQVKIFSQSSWTKHGSPVLLPGSAGEWDNNGVTMPCVIFDGNTYKMWYSGTNGTTFRIGYATSLDGINWTKYNDPATVDPPYAESDPVVNLGTGTWENVWVYGPIVFFDGATYRMWYAGTDGDHDRVGYATSPDGIIWTKNPANPVINLGTSGSWDNTSVDPGPVIFNGLTFVMIYNGSDGLHYQGGYATSIDGINWTKSPDPVITYGSVGSWDNPRVQPNSLVYNDSTSKYFLFYSGGVLFDWRIGYATAPALNGPWAKDPSIMLDVTQGGFDNDVVGFPYVIEDSGSNLYKMWYAGGSSGSPGAIGYATTPSWPVAVEEEIKIPENYFLEQNFPNPFNPMTKIQYSIPQSSNVTIKIFDILGSEIEILVNEEKPIGTYEVNWNAVNLPSGVYFYQLKAGEFTSVKKMILLK